MDDSKYIGGVELSQTSAYIRKFEYLDPDWFVMWYTIIIWDVGAWHEMIDFTTMNSKKRDYDFENFIHGVFNHGSTVGRVINEPPPNIDDHKAGED
jgi:hypothetical protein